MMRQCKDLKIVRALIKFAHIFCCFKNTQQRKPLQPKHLETYPPVTQLSHDRLQKVRSWRLQSWKPVRFIPDFSYSTMRLLALPCFAFFLRLSASNLRPFDSCETAAPSAFCESHTKDLSSLLSKLHFVKLHSHKRCMSLCNYFSLYELHHLFALHLQPLCIMHSFFESQGQLFTLCNLMFWRIS